MWKTLLNQAPKKEIYVSENKEIKGEAHHEIIFPSKMLYEIVTNQGNPGFWILEKWIKDLLKYTMLNYGYFSSFCQFFFAYSMIFQKMYSAL